MRIKPYYKERGIKIYNGECIGLLPYLPKFDVVITDPPYGINHPTNYRTRGRGKLARCRDYNSVYGDDKPFDPSPWLKYPCLLFGANYYSAMLPHTSGWVVWDKKRPENLDQSTCELAWSNFVKGVRIFHYLWNGCMRQGNEKLVHPTQKPVALMEWVINLRWTPGGVILDPYMGSGSTLIAAKLSKRSAIGVEYSEEYCEIAKRRLQEI